LTTRSTIVRHDAGVLALDSKAFFKAALIFGATFALYFFSRSPGLDEIDSVQFAMGVREFNIWMHQPHPPGYPIYIFFGWIGAKCFHWSPDFSLHVVSALGGALFVAAWFLIIWLQFRERLAWCISICLAITPAVWMTATKVLTDSLAAGFLSAELVAALIYFYGGRTRALIAVGVLGAAATGTRPQMIAVVLIIMLTALQGRGWKMRLLALTTFLGGCMLWLVPMWWSQARLKSNVPVWLVYPQLLYGQWQWRLDKPQVFLGAGDWSLKYFGLRFFQHILGWFGIGFGFVQARWILIAGIVIVTVALAAYLFLKREVGDRRFWGFHGPWAIVHVAIIFVCLPPAQRYYVVIFPLLLVTIIRGLLQMPKGWHLSAIAFPLLLLYIDIPIVLANHRDEAPPVQLVHYLEKFYPPSKRSHVMVLFVSAKRHVNWYAPGFKTFPELPAPSDLPALARDVTTIFVDNRGIPLPPGWRLIPLVEFHRSTVIHTKHRHITLYLVARGHPL
jgi:hypothetical protein